jgi:hypothetical protein
MYSDSDSRPGVKVAICPDTRTDIDGYRNAVLQMYGMDHKPTITACIPAVFTEKKKRARSRSPSTGKNSASLTQWIEKFLSYYSTLGVDHFFLYSLGTVLPLSTDVPHTWIDMSWALNVTKTSAKGKRGMWYHGQYWSMNDCLYRNKAVGSQWVLFQDYDEIFSSKSKQTLRDVLNTVDSKTDSVMFGNYIVNMHDCGSSLEQDWRTCERY